MLMQQVAMRHALDSFADQYAARISAEGTLPSGAGIVPAEVSVKKDTWLSPYHAPMARVTRLRLNPFLTAHCSRGNESYPPGRTEPRRSPGRTELQNSSPSKLDWLRENSRQAAAGTPKGELVVFGADNMHPVPVKSSKFGYVAAIRAKREATRLDGKQQPRPPTLQSMPPPTLQTLWSGVGLGDYCQSSQSRQTPRKDDSFLIAAAI